MRTQRVVRSRAAHAWRRAGIQIKRRLLVPPPAALQRLVHFVACHKDTRMPTDHCQLAQSTATASVIVIIILVATSTRAAGTHYSWLRGDTRQHHCCRSRRTCRRCMQCRWGPTHTTGRRRSNHPSCGSSSGGAPPCRHGARSCCVVGEQQVRRLVDQWWSPNNSWVADAARQLCNTQCSACSTRRFLLNVSRSRDRAAQHLSRTPRAHYLVMCISPFSVVLLRASSTRGEKRGAEDSTAATNQQPDDYRICTSVTHSCK